MPNACSICMFGPDGAGKSTLAGLVAGYYASRGRRVRVSWIRGTHTLSSLLARLLHALPTIRGPCNPYYNVCIPKPLRWLWAWLEVASALPLIAARFLLPRLRGYVVVGERGPVDLLVWLTVTLRWPGAHRSAPGRLLIPITLSVCDHLVYVSADPHILAERRSGYPEAPTIPVQIALYDRIAEALETLRVNTSNITPGEAARLIIESAGGKCG